MHPLASTELVQLVLRSVPLQLEGGGKSELTIFESLVAPPPSSSLPSSLLITTTSSDAVLALCNILLFPPSSSHRNRRYSARSRAKAAVDLSLRRFGCLSLEPKHQLETFASFPPQPTTPNLHSPFVSTTSCHVGSIWKKTAETREGASSYSLRRSRRRRLASCLVEKG